MPELVPGRVRTRARRDVGPRRGHTARVAALAVLWALAVPAAGPTRAWADPLTSPGGPATSAAASVHGSAAPGPVAPGDGLVDPAHERALAAASTASPGATYSTGAIGDLESAHPATEVRRLAAAAATLTNPVAALTLPLALDPRPVYQGQISCDPVDKPGSTALGRLLVGTYAVGTFGVSRWCDGSQSEHMEGRAVDWMLDSTDPAQKVVGDAATTWLTADSGVQARRLGVQYVIWNRLMWRAYAPERGWQPYGGSNPHTDHVHLSLSWDGAMRRTSWWSGAVAATADVGPCRLYTGVLAPIWEARRTSPCAPAGTAPTSPRPTYVPGQQGGDIAAAQRLLGVTADGSFGYGTRNALLAYQRRVGAPRTGVLDATTWLRLLPAPTPSPAPVESPITPPTPAPVTPPVRTPPAELPARVTTRFAAYTNLRLHPGSTGAVVRVLQRGLGVRVTGVVDTRTVRAVRALQAAARLPVTGVVDARTWRRVEARQFPWLGQSTRLAPGARGAAVVALQRGLRLRADGVFGAATKAAVHQVQRRYGLPATGLVDAMTWRAVAAAGPR